MADQEKVMKWLNEIVLTLTPFTDEEDSDSSEQEICRLAADALELLKEQIPRVLTLEEVRNGPLEIGWLEDFDKCNVIPGIRFRLINEGEDETVVFQVADGFIAPRLACYGDTWRCWNKKPTLKQMDDTPWKRQVLRYVDKDTLQSGLAPAT